MAIQWQVRLILDGTNEIATQPMHPDTKLTPAEQYEQCLASAEDMLRHTYFDWWAADRLSVRVETRDVTDWTPYKDTQ